eukprot:gene16508-biopygen14063
MMRMISGAAARKATVLSSVLLASTMLTGVTSVLAQDTTVGEVIVTAQKRSEDLQDVPVSIQAIGGERLEALVVSDFNDYVKYLPSVSFQSTAPGFSSVYMRGVASGGSADAMRSVTRRLRVVGNEAQRMVRAQRPQHRRVGGDVLRTQQCEYNEPHHRDRAEQATDVGGTEALEDE